jgi:secreted PhoX family phosphatase
MEAPKTDQEKAQMYSNASVEVTYIDGTKKVFPLHYETLYRPGDIINGKTAGSTTDVNGNIFKKSDGTPYVTGAPDINTLLHIPGMPDNTYYMVTQQESMPASETGGKLPSNMVLNMLKQDPQTGKLTMTDTNPIDFSSVHGIMNPCAGSMSPWNTHLGSEESEPDARAHEAKPESSSATTFARSYYNNPTMIGNPYYYGHVPEVSVNADGSSNTVKHYSMGRMAFERVKVLPDNRTVLYGVDSNPGGFFMYVADQERDLSSGTLYAAKWHQNDIENGGSADLEWINLGHATDNEIQQYADNLKFSDIFDVTDDPVIGQAQGYKRVKTAGNGKKDEWLKVKPGMEQAAAFLETHRYAAYVGATVELNKMEGIDFNEQDNKAYFAISYLEKTMTKNPTEPADDIHLPQISAGGVFEIGFDKNSKSNDGKTIHSKYIPTTVSGLVMGEDLKEPDEAGNKANVDKIANPDNVVYSEKMRALFIAEDSDLHANNFTWAYSLDTKKLSRINSVPTGGEATGLQVWDDLDGFSYLMLNAQHPAYVGYLAGMPSLTQGTDKKEDKRQNYHKDHKDNS